MANFPTALDPLPRVAPYTGDNQSIPYWQRFKVLQEKVGCDNSAVATSLDYRTRERGYIMPFYITVLGTSMTDSTTYFGGLPVGTIMTTYAQAKLPVPKSGTIKRFDLKMFNSGAASNETVSHYLRLNDTTDFGQLDTTYDVTDRLASVTGLSQAVVAGDTMALKIVTPAWATNPTTVRAAGFAWIEGV
jgi:hypothetical protein